MSESDASGLDAVLRRHLALLLIGVQSGEDADVVRLARSETHRLVGAVTACLRAHMLDAGGACTACRSPHCLLRKDISRALLPIRPALPNGG
jgi:hypothetical protein